MATHKAHEDVQGLLTGAVLAALGITLFNEAGILAGGTVGLALLLNYASGLDLSLALLLANAPFYALACLRMGREFTLKTLAVVLLTSLIVKLLPQGLGFSHISPVVAAVLGGLLAGVGMLALFRHRASLGGFNVLVLYLQDKWGWSPGKVQMLLDAIILAGGGLVFMDWRRLAVSLVGAVTLNLVLAVNHRPGRYSPAGT
jgi:uncharacterized membrane-anchored protein YitT (DUF2179 family)